MADILANPILLCALAALAPAVAFASVNTRFFTARQMAQSAGVAVVVGAVLGLLLWLLASYLGAAGVGEGYASALLGLCAGVIFFVFSERLVTELSKTKKARLIANLSGLTVFVLLSSLLSPAVLSGLLIVYLGFSLFDLYKKNNPQKELLVYEQLCAAGAKQSVSSEKPERPFKYKPNVYLLFLESMHSEKAAKLIYNIPPDPAMAEFYREHGFTVYEDFFSNNGQTLYALNSLIENKLTDYVGQLEYPPYALRHFLQNGYKFNLFDYSHYVFSRYSRWADYCSFFLPLWVKRLYGFCGSLFAQSAWLRKLVLGIDLFETGIDFNYIYNAVEQRLRKQSGGDPVFSIIRFGARHYDQNYSTETWAETYPPLYAHTQDEIKKMAGLIIRHDPDAVIIATGDHGAMQYLDLWINGDINDNIARTGITHELAARSFFDVLLAVRWPEMVVKPPKLHTHINIFKHLFAILADDKSVLADVRADISHRFNYLAARKGKPLEPFEYIGSEVLEYDIQEAEKSLDGANDKAGQIQLAQLVRRKNPAKAERIIRKVLQQGPDIAAESILESILFKQNRLDEAGEIYQARLEQGSRELNDWLRYSDVLKAWGRPEEALALLLDARKQFGGASKAINSSLLSFYYYLGRDEEGIQFYRNNYKVEKNENSPATLLYFKMLFRRGELEKLNHCFTLLPPDSLRIVLHLSVYNIGFTLLKMRMQDWDAPRLTRVQESKGLIAGGWGDFVTYYCMEKQGDINSVVASILEKIGDNTGYKYKAQLAEYLGKLIVRHNLKAPALDVFKKLAMAAVQDRFLEYKKAGIFDEAWYKAKYMDGKPGLKMHPIMHYQYQGVFEGAFPNQYFDTYHYIETVREVFQQGLDPLQHHLNYGTRCLADPSPEFSTRRYMYEHKIPFGGDNPLVHLLARERAAKAAS
ncbi:MAG: hypothetical protein IJD04_07205 [Desulfovibrionaceae bacterium]|nr:hypothetical protein [Desulfovibrionaceae bacterium]